MIVFWLWIKAQLSMLAIIGYFIKNSAVYKKLYEIETFKKMDNIEHIGIAVSDQMRQMKYTLNYWEPNRTNRNM